MKALMKKIISMILVVAIMANIGLAGVAEAVSGEKKSAGDVFAFAQKITWAEAGRQIAGMLGYIVEDAADIDLDALSERIEKLSLEDDSVYLAILAEEGYLPEEPARINPAATITADEYVKLMELAFPTVVDSQEAVDSLRGESKPGNVAILGDDLSVSTMLPDRLAVARAQQLSLTAVKAAALSMNAGSSVDLSESEIARVHIRDTAVKEEVKPGEEDEPDVIYLHMDSGTQLPEVIVKSADEVVIEGSGALGVVRVQEAVGSLTVRATGSVINETDEPFEVTGPDAEVVELQPGEQVDFVLSKWLVSFVTEGTSVETQEIVPGGMVDYTKANTTLEGKIFTAWYEDADYTTPVSRLSTVDREMTLYARFVDEADAAIVTFETFGGRELEPMVFAKGEYLLTKPVEKYTFEISSEDTGWTSGSMELKNRAMLDLPLSKRGKNAFRIEVYDDSGRSINLDNNRIEIAYTLATVGTILASHSIGVEVCENSMSNHSVLDYLVREGEPLPAKGQKTFRATETIKAGSYDGIHFKLWEGDQQDDVEDNRFIGCMNITGRDFDFGMIMPGAEIVCDYVVTDSGSIELDISVPSISESFNNDKNFYSRQEGQIDLDAASEKINFDGKNLLEKVKETYKSLPEVEDEAAFQKLGEVASEAMNLKADNKDREYIQKLNDRVIQAKQSINKIRRANIEVIREQQLARFQASYQEDYAELANEEERERYQKLFAAAKDRISEAGNGFEGIIEQVRYLNYNVLAKHDEFIVMDFKRLASEPENYENKAQFEMLCHEGIKALENKDIDTLRQVVDMLWATKRSDEQDDNAKANIVRG